jgi:isohexenylglutaconyl-CoA hydratase
MSLEMVAELEQVVALATTAQVRAMVLRGAGGHFCAGADIRDLAAARHEAPGADGEDPIAAVNRAFGRMLTAVDRVSFAVVAVLEGAAMGGGLGLACVADVTLADVDARLRLPETRLGVPPAQVAPFLVRRLGLSQARRLAVTGGTFEGRAAKDVGLVHEVCAGSEALEARLKATLAEILAGAPGAIAATKALVLAVDSVPHETLLDRGAQAFAAAVRSEEGQEGTLAFLQKRPPAWATIEEET